MTVVDIHCHTFNADDLPIRGFIYHLKLDEIALGAALSNVVDFLLQGAATSYHADMARLDSILGPTPAFEAAKVQTEPQSPAQFEREVDQALAALQSSKPTVVYQIGEAMAAAQVTTGTSGEENLLDPVFAARRAIRWVKMFTRSRLDQAADLVRTFGDEVDLFTPMLVDLGTGLGDLAQTSNREQMVLYEKISRLSMLSALPGVKRAHIHFFVGFDPLRELRSRQVNEIEKPLDVVKSAILNYGFVGVKVYPQMGWRPSGNKPYGPIDEAEARALDEIVLELARWCADNDVPITAHGSSSNYADPHYDRAHYGSPEQWLPVVKECTNLHLNLGHFGGARKIEPPDGWPWRIARAMAVSDGVFADVGNHRIDNEEVVTGYFAMLQSMRQTKETAAVADRLMYGSDWFMSALHPRADQFLSSYRTAYNTHFADSKLTDAFMGGNALRFLGFNDRRNQNSIRLRERYAKFAPNNVPAWLA